MSSTRALRHHSRFDSRFLGGRIGPAFGVQLVHNSIKVVVVGGDMQVSVLAGRFIHVARNAPFRPAYEKHET
jgi:hypothetical protein